MTTYEQAEETYNRGILNIQLGENVAAFVNFAQAHNQLTSAAVEGKIEIPASDDTTTITQRVKQFQEFRSVLEEAIIDALGMPADISMRAFNALQSVPAIKVALQMDYIIGNRSKDVPEPLKLVYDVGSQGRTVITGQPS